MTKPYKSTGQIPDKPRAHRGGFRLDGSWDPDGNPENPLTRYVWQFCRARRTSDLSPRALGLQLESGPFARTFATPALARWLELRDVNDWPLTPASNSAQQAIIHEGYGGSAWSWQRGHCIAQATGTHQSSVEYASFRVGILEAIRIGATPEQVAKALEDARIGFPEIDPAEIDAYHAMGKTWRPWEPSAPDPAPSPVAPEAPPEPKNPQS